MGEYVHQLARALAAMSARPLLQNHETVRVDATIFSSSWKDRLRVPPDLAGTSCVDRRIPVALLNLAWHRLEWPPVELLAGASFDIVHSLHPLLMPSRSAAQVVTIHDLNFMSHPERTRAEIRRDYPALAASHARRADAIVVPSAFTAREVERTFDLDVAKVSVCSPGAPDWTPRATHPADGYILFFGTLEPRKNVGALLDAYERLLQLPERAAVPELVLAGQATAEGQAWLNRIARPPLAGHVRHIGYVDPLRRLEVYDQARLLVQPSFEEGFGIPVLEAMTRGVPVVAANRGALPEVLGDAGLLVDPSAPDEMAAAIARMLTDQSLVERSITSGIARARTFQWSATAARMIEVYEWAIARRHAVRSTSTAASS